jgi:hypothetical protein
METATEVNFNSSFPPSCISAFYVSSVIGTEREEGTCDLASNVTDCRKTAVQHRLYIYAYHPSTIELPLEETILLTTSEAPINLGLIIPGAFYITPLFKILYQHDILPENSLKHEGHFILILLMSGDRLLSFD